MAGELTLDRTRFGIGSGEWATPDPIGLDVKVKFKVTLRRGS
jgi:polyisoprenoid-binding protein YceI